MYMLPAARDAVVGALEDLRIPVESLVETKVLGNVATLLTNVAPDQARRTLAERFRPLIESLCKPESFGTEMIAKDAPPLAITLSETPAAALLLNPRNGFASGAFEPESGDDSPLMIMSDMTQTTYCSEVNSETGEIDVDIPVIGTVTSADVLRDQDFIHTGRLKVQGTVFAPSRDFKARGVPQIHIADVNVDVRSKPLNIVRKNSFMVADLTKVPSDVPSGVPLDDDIFACPQVKIGEGKGECKVEGKICGYRMGMFTPRCTTVKISKAGFELTLCFCLLRPDSARTMLVTN